jgi:hypothetical protein
VTRALLAVLAMLLIACPAQAKTLIVADAPYKKDGLGYGFAATQVMHNRLSMITRIMDLAGASYVVIPVEAMRTQWARTGVVTWDFGTSSARTETFDAVIHATFVRRSFAASRDHAGYRPDFLTINGADSLPTVPQLFLLSADAASGGSENNIVTTATTCSLGVPTSGFMTAGINGVGHDEEASLFVPHRPMPSGSQALDGCCLVSPAQVVGKGFRPLVVKGTNPIGSTYGYHFTWRTNWDSTTVANTDTVKVWSIQNTHASGKSPVIVAHISDFLGDGADGIIAAVEEFDIQAILYGMAALDSAARGRVFDNSAKLPIKVGITIDGLCSRSSATNSGGIVPSDTSRFYATVDSLNKYGIKVVYGTNIDSVCCYPRDLQYVKDRHRAARFSPQSRAGLDTSVAFAPTGGNTRRHRAVDTFCRYRNQSMAYGPARGAAADTSLYARLVYARALGDSMWGAVRSSSFAMPPDDDWSPYNLRAWQVDMSRGATPDSVLFAYARAGFRGIRINGAWMKARPANSPNNPLGYMPEQGRYETADRSLSINLLAHNGGSTFGYTAIPATIDSTPPNSADPPPSEGWYVARRFWSGLFGYYPMSFRSGLTSDENSTAQPQRGRILRVSCQELAGPATLTPNYAQTQRPGWWTIRKVVGPITGINALAGRPIFAIVYPEEIEP